MRICLMKVDFPDPPVPKKPTITTQINEYNTFTRKGKDMDKKTVFYPAVALRLPFLCVFFSASAIGMMEPWKTDYGDRPYEGNIATADRLANSLRQLKLLCLTCLWRTQRVISMHFATPTIGKRCAATR